MFLLNVLGCSTKEDSIKPTQLQSFDASVKFKRQWQRSIGKGVAGQKLVLQPAVTADAVFTLDPEGRLTSRSRATGDKLWQKKLGLSTTAGVTADDTQLYVGLVNGDLAAFSQASGEAVWRVPLNGEILAPVDTARDFLAVHTINGRVHLLNRNRGDSLWVYDAVLPALTLRGAAAPIIAGQQVMAGLSNGKLIALDLNSGLVRWERLLGVSEGRSELDRLMDVDSDLWLGDGVIAASSYQGRVALLEAGRGRPIWSRELSSYHALAGDEQAIYVMDEQSRLWALEKVSGRTLWQQDVLLARRATGCALISGLCVVGDFEGYLHAFEVATGALVGRTRLGQGPIQQPLAVDEHLFVINAKGRLAVLRLDS